MIEEPNSGARAPMHEASWPTDLFEKDMGCVVIAPFKSGGQRVEAGVFLLDVFCLGVKDAFYEDIDRQGYFDIIRGRYEAKFPVIPIEPCCARKLVEQTVSYAEGLGFNPHPDYKKAARVFGGLKTEECGRQFTFGRDGKPFYCSGPNETEEQSCRIVTQLTRRCGEGNFHYLVGMGGAEQEE